MDSLPVLAAHATSAQRVLEAVISWRWPIVATLVPAIVIYVYWSWPSWKVRHIPGPPTIFGIGHLHLLDKHGAELFPMLREKYGNIYRFHLGRQPLIMLADPELCRLLAVKNAKLAPNRSTPPYVTCNPVLQRGLFFTRDDRWRAMRNIFLPLFHKSSIVNYLPVMTERADKLCTVLDHLVEQNAEKADVNMSKLLLRATVDVVGATAFGTNFGQLDSTKIKVVSDKSEENEDQDLINSILTAIELLRMDGGASLSIVLGIMMPILQHLLAFLLERIPGTFDYTQKKLNASICKLTDDLMERRRQESKEVQRNRVDTLSLMLKAMDEDKTTSKILTPEYVTALSYEQLLAGSDTTAAALSMVLYTVAMHPDVEKKLLAEIDAFGPPSKNPTAEDLDSKFPYVDQVIKETERLHSTAPLIAREASEAMDLGGYHIEKGTWVWMAANAVQRHPDHFSDPEKFRPERYDPESEESKKRNPYTFLVFGAGPRMCIGHRYSMQEVQVMLIKLYQKFTFRHSPLMEYPLKIQFGIIAKPKYGVLLQPQRRNRAV